MRGVCNVGNEFSEVNGVTKIESLLLLQNALMILLGAQNSYYLTQSGDRAAVSKSFLRQNYSIWCKITERALDSWGFQGCAKPKCRDRLWPNRSRALRQKSLVGDH
jgi:hypothetical protein